MTGWQIKDSFGSTLTFSQLSYGPDGFAESYWVSLATPDMHMSIEVDGRRYAGFEQGEEHFFSDLAGNWRGWKGEKSFQTLEDDLQLTATSDHTGHVELGVRLIKYRACQTEGRAGLVLEAGQLENIAADAHKFFKKRLPDTR